LLASIVALAQVIGHAETTAFPTMQFSNKFDTYPDMLSAVHDEHRLKAMYVDYMSHEHHLLKLRAVYTQTSWQHAVFSTALGLVKELPPHQRDLAPKRLVAEFGTEVICLQAYSYMYLFPHNILGRYPAPSHGGQTTADVYGARADRVLYKIHVSYRFDFDLLSEQISALDCLWGMGNRDGHW